MMNIQKEMLLTNNHVVVLGRDIGDDEVDRTRAQWEVGGERVS